MKTQYIMIGLWVALSVVLLPLFLPLLNADGTSYISIANQYWRGNWAQAVNGFWGPLLSWLLLPFLAAGLAPVTAAKIVLLLAGIPMILALRRIAAELELGEPLTTLLLTAAIPIGVYMALCMITPDFLVAVILLVYLAVFLRSGFPRSLSEGGYCGLLGALAYWTKPFAFFFFLAHFLGFSFVRLWFRRKGAERRQFLAAVLTGAAVFAVLSGTWIGIISHKYGHPLINSSSRVNWSYLRPGSPGQPVLTEGFLPPPNKIAISAWEDPTLIPVTEWSPFQSRRDFVYFLGLVKANTMNLYRSLVDFFPLAPLVLLGGAVVAVFRGFGRRASPRAIRIGMLTFTLALYSAGYALILVEERYIWIDWYLVLLILGGLIAAIPWKNRWKLWGRGALAVVLFSAFLVLPIRFFGQSQTISASDTRMPAREVYEIAKILKSRFGIVGSTASNRNWNEMLFITTFNHGQYFGQMMPTWSSAELESALLRYRIRYFFLWRDNDPLFNFLNDYIEVTRGEIPGLKVFQMKKRSKAEWGNTLKSGSPEARAVDGNGFWPEGTGLRPRRKLSARIDNQDFRLGHLQGTPLVAYQIQKLLHDGGFALIVLQFRIMEQVAKGDFQHFDRRTGGNCQEKTGRRYFYQFEPGYLFQGLVWADDNQGLTGSHFDKFHGFESLLVGPHHSRRDLDHGPRPIGIDLGKLVQDAHRQRHGHGMAGLIKFRRPPAAPDSFLFTKHNYII